MENQSSSIFKKAGIFVVIVVTYILLNMIAFFTENLRTSLVLVLVATFVAGAAFLEVTYPGKYLKLLPLRMLIERWVAAIIIAIAFLVIAVLIIVNGHAIKKIKTTQKTSAVTAEVFHLVVLSPFFAKATNGHAKILLTHQRSP